MKRTDVIALAEDAAVFLRQLIEEGVSLGDAVHLTSTFVSQRVYLLDEPQEVPEPPLDPWEDV